MEDLEEEWWWMMMRLAEFRTSGTREISERLANMEEISERDV